MRKVWLMAAAMLPVAAMAQTAGRGLSNYPEQPKAEPFQETVFNVAIDDPYRWMEKADRHAELEAWVNASSLHTTTELAALLGRDELFKEMQAVSRAADRYYGVAQAGGRLFYQKLGTGAQIPVLMVRDGGKDRLLFDPMAGTDGKTPRAISSYSVSPDGRYVAIHVGEGGGETGAIRIYDVATGQPGADILSPVWGEFRAKWGTLDP